MPSRTEPCWVDLSWSEPLCSMNRPSEISNNYKWTEFRFICLRNFLIVFLLLQEFIGFLYISSRKSLSSSKHGDISIYCKKEHIVVTMLEEIFFSLFSIFSLIRQAYNDYNYHGKDGSRRLLFENDLNQWPEQFDSFGIIQH